MVESQRKVATPELYEKLIDRLGVALDAARTAGRLRDERPVELELRGLSPAEFELVEAYLEQVGHQTSTSEAQVLKRLDTPRSAKVVWLKDRTPDKDAVRIRSLQFK
ncbi:hypothetical protein LOY47_26370 [Pseudomonas brassicacearum]|uniref:Uncharacterized protein n=1 Tax=Pseudomonas brassicacearum (strain NFM421) TaxID=994484 RepID=F2K5T3_PSEBN|nr:MULTISPECIES: hypothetical protein [Pseudomonas]EIK58257.1 hypothetical protein PflQ8_5083 [Pseudomonas fluorescens Q8r1-96]RDH99160.1 hypothetical protein DFO59_110195 [Pseudomonas fluorescens]AEA71372.1 Conserved hypothetical protein [Pseudomonas brassicacearum subsp. brassicacearum NFM421]ALQ05897.1 hypothetical protein AK973_5448 [Pseudomonas brassicacearum]AOS41021.1 hypothetical protein A0U95_20255 [Pseudomonas brassicacearum]